MRIWIAAAVLLALVAIALVAIPYVLPWERYRSDIETAIEDITGHEIAIKGPIDLSLFPRPVLTVGDVAATSREGGAVGFDLTSEQVDMGFRIGPLLVGRPIVNHVTLTGPTLALDQETSERLASWPPKLDDWSSAFFQPALRRVTITDGRLDHRGRDAPAAATVSDVSLTLTMATDKGPLKASGLFKTHNHRFTIDARIGEQSNDGSSTIKAEIGAKNGIDETTKLNFAGVLQRQSPEIGLQGRANFQGPDLRSGLKAISVITGSPWSFPSLARNQPFKVQSRIEATPDMLFIEDAKIALDDKFGSGDVTLKFGYTPGVDLKIDLPTIRLADEASLIDVVPLDLLSVLPTVPGKIDLRLREIAYRTKSLRRAVINIETDKSGATRIEKAKAILPGLVDIQFSGSLRPSGPERTLRGQLTSVGDDLGETLRWLGIPLSDQVRGWRGFSLESKVAIDAAAIALSAIDMRLDASAIGGDVALFIDDRPKLDVDVDVERLDLGLYTTESSPAELARRLGRQFEQLDASIDTRFHRLAWRGLNFDEVALSARARQQQIKIRAFTLQTVGETAMTVEGEIDLKADAVALKAELESQFPARVLRHLDLGLPLSSTRLEPVTLSGTVSGMLSDADIGLQVDYDDGQGSLQGKAGWVDERAHYDLAIKAKHPDHRALAGHFGLAPLVPADDADGPFGIDGQLRREQNGNWIAGGSVKLGPTGFTGRLTRQDTTPPEMWEARVSIGDPRKDSLAPFLNLAGLRSTGNWTPRSILGRLPQMPLRTAWLDDVNGTLSLSAKGGLADEGIKLSASLDKGFLYVNEFKADLWNGAITAEMSLERRREQPFASIAIQLDQVDADALTDWLHLPKTIEGPLKLELDAASVGNTVFELIKGVSGKLSIDAGPGKLYGKAIPTFRKTLHDRIGADRETSSSPNKDPLTMPLMGFKTTGTLNRGMAILDEGLLTFDPGFGAEAEARIEGTLDLLLWITELTMNVTAEDVGMTPLSYKIVGSPARPQGYILDR